MLSTLAQVNVSPTMIFHTKDVNEDIANAYITKEIINMVDCIDIRCGYRDQNDIGSMKDEEMIIRGILSSDKNVSSMSYRNTHATQRIKLKSLLRLIDNRPWDSKNLYNNVMPTAIQAYTVAVKKIASFPFSLARGVIHRNSHMLRALSVQVLEL